MRASLIVAVLFLCICNGRAFADDAPTNAVVQGNQGYVYGAPPKADDSATASAGDSTVTTSEFAWIKNAYKKINDWSQENLW